MLVIKPVPGDHTQIHTQTITDKHQDKLQVQCQETRHYLHYLVPALSEAWFAVRQGTERVSFSASRVAEALGLSIYAAPWHYYDYRLRPWLYPDQTEDTAAMQAGREQEPLIAAAFARDMRCDVQEIGVFASKKLRWILASPDRLITRGQYQGSFVEIKHLMFDNMPKWPPKITHLCQCMVQMFVTATPSSFLVYGNGHIIRIFRVYFSRELWQFMETRLTQIREALLQQVDRYYETPWYPDIVDEYWQSLRAKKTKRSPPPVPMRWQAECTCPYHVGGILSHTRGGYQCDHLPPMPKVNEMIIRNGRLS